MKNNVNTSQNKYVKRNYLINPDCVLYKQD